MIYQFDDRFSEHFIEFSLNELEKIRNTAPLHYEIENPHNFIGLIYSEDGYTSHAFHIGFPQRARLHFMRDVRKCMPEKRKYGGLDMLVFRKCNPASHKLANAILKLKGVSKPNAYMFLLQELSNNK